MGLEFRTYQPTLHYNDTLRGEPGRIYYRTESGAKSNANGISILPRDDDGNVFYYSIDDPIDIEGEVELRILLHWDSGPGWYYTVYTKRVTPSWATANETVFEPPHRIETARYGYNDLIIGTPLDRNDPRVDNDGDIIYDRFSYRGPDYTTIIAITKSWKKYQEATLSSVEITNGHDLSSHLAPYRPPQANISLIFKDLTIGTFPNIAVDDKVRIVDRENGLIFTPFTGLVKEKAWSDEITADGVPLYRLTMTCYGNSIILQSLPVNTDLGTAQDVTDQLTDQIKESHDLVLRNELTGGFQLFDIRGRLKTDMFTMLTNFAHRNTRYPARFVETGTGEFVLTQTNPDRRDEVQLKIRPGTNYSEQFRSTIQGIKYNAYETERNASEEVTLFEIEINTGNPPGNRDIPTADDARTYDGSINTSHPDYDPNDRDTWRPVHNWYATGPLTGLRWYWIGPVVDPVNGYTYTYNTPDNVIIGDQFGLSVLTFTADSLPQENSLDHTYRVAPNRANITGTFRQEHPHFTGRINQVSKKADGTAFRYEDGKVIFRMKINTYPYNVVQKIWPPGVDDENVLSLNNNPGLRSHTILTLAKEILARERRGYREVSANNLSMEEVCQIDSYKQIAYNYYGQPTVGVILKYTLSYSAHTPFWSAKLSVIDADKPAVRGAGKQLGIWNRRFEIIGEFTTSNFNRLRTGFWSIVWDGTNTVLSIGDSRSHNNGRHVTSDDFAVGDTITVDHFGDTLQRVVINSVTFDQGDDQDATIMTWAGNSYNLNLNQQLGGSGSIVVVNRTKVAGSLYLRDIAGSNRRVMEYSEVDSLGNTVPDPVVGNVYHFYSNDTINLKTIPDVSSPHTSSNAQLIVIDKITTDTTGDATLKIVNFTMETGTGLYNRNRDLDDKIALYEVSHIQSATTDTGGGRITDTNCVVDPDFIADGFLRISDKGFLKISDDGLLLIRKGE